MINLFDLVAFLFRFSLVWLELLFVVFVFWAVLKRPARRILDWGAKWEANTRKREEQAKSAAKATREVSTSSEANEADSAYRRGDYAEAMRLFRLAAEKGVADAQYNLGFMYANAFMYHDRFGISQDYVQAHMWTNLAAEQGFNGAQIVRDRIAQRMTPDQIDEAQRLARDWKSAALTK